MAKQGTKTEMLKCVVTVDTVTFQHVKRNGEEWQVAGELAIDCKSVPDKLEDRDGFASMKAYGIRAFLSDRTSQFREHGIQTTLAEMGAVYLQLRSGIYRTKRSSSKKVNDRDIVAQAIAALKKVSMEVATASVKQLTAEQFESLKANPAVAAKVKELKAAVADAEVVDLDDLFATEEA